MRGKPHREADQRQAPAAGAAQHPALYPLGFATSRQEALEFEIRGRDRLERADAERLDPQLAAQGPNPTAAREQPIAGALDMQQDLGRDLAGLAFRRGIPAPGQGGSRGILVLYPGSWTVEAAQVERECDRRLLGRTVSGDNDMTATRRRPDDHGSSLGAEPGPAPRERGDDLGPVAILGKRRRDLRHRKLD